MVLAANQKGTGYNVNGAFFEVLVDEKMVSNKGRLGSVRGESTEPTDFIVYLPMSEINTSIARARRRRRTNGVVYDKREFDAAGQEDR